MELLSPWSRPGRRPAGAASRDRRCQPPAREPQQRVEGPVGHTPPVACRATVGRGRARVKGSDWAALSFGHDGTTGRAASGLAGLARPLRAAGRSRLHAALRQLANALGARGEHARTDEVFLESLDVLRTAGKDRFVAWTLNDLGYSLLGEGRLAEGEALLLELVGCPSGTG